MPKIYGVKLRGSLPKFNYGTDGPAFLGFAYSFNTTKVFIPKHEYYEACQNCGARREDKEWRCTFCGKSLFKERP